MKSTLSSSLLILLTASALSAQTRVLKPADGNGQIAPVGSALSQVPSVRLTDERGEACGGEMVAFEIFSGDGMVERAAAVADANGIATPGAWTLGSERGVNRLTAFAPAAEPATLSALAVPAKHAVIATESGSGGLLRLGGSRTLRARVTADLAAVAGVPVKWRVVAGGGKLSESTSTTDARGYAEIRWTTGKVRGMQTVAASIAGGSAWFTAVTANRVYDAVRDFQAPNLGVRNARTQIQRALTEARKAGGGVVYLPPGKYRVTKPLYVGSNVHLVGAGRGVSVVMASADPWDEEIERTAIAVTIGMVAANNASVSSLTVDHAKFGSISNGIATLPAGPDLTGRVATDCTISDVEVIGSGNAHTYLIWNLRGQRIRIVNNQVDGRTEGYGLIRNVFGDGMQEGIESFGGAAVVIAGNSIRNVNGSCINLASSGLPNTMLEDVVAENNETCNCWRGASIVPSFARRIGGQNVRGVLLRNNVFHDSWAHGVYVALFRRTWVRDVRIERNEIDGVRDVVYGAGSGIELRGDAGQKVDSARNVLVADNLVRNTGGQRSSSVVVASFPRVRIERNVLVAPGGIGIHAFAGHNAEIVGNILIDVPSSGIVAESAASDQTVSDNMIWRWDSFGVDSPAVRVSDADGAVVERNLFYSTALAGPGVVIPSSSKRVVMQWNELLSPSKFSEPMVNQSGEGLLRTED